MFYMMNTSSNCEKKNTLLTFRFFFLRHRTTLYVSATSLKVASQA